MKLNIEITEADLKRLVVAELHNRLGDVPISIENVTIEVKSKQNYKSEWEVASFRAQYVAEV